MKKSLKTIKHDLIKENNSKEFNISKNREKIKRSEIEINTISSSIEFDEANKKYSYKLSNEKHFNFNTDSLLPNKMNLLSTEISKEIK